MSYISLARVLCLSLLSPFMPPPPRTRVKPPPHSSQRRRYTLPPPVHAITSSPRAAAPSLIRNRRRAQTAPLPLALRPRAAHLRHPHAPPSPSAAKLLTSTPSTPKPQPPRLQASTPFTPQPQPFHAHQVFEVLPKRDGSREKEGEGGRCGEARPQADSRRKRGREGRDGGQGRRRAGVRPCSPVRDQGSASQGQGQRQRYGPSQRCQGHQSHD